MRQGVRPSKTTMTMPNAMPRWWFWWGHSMRPKRGHSKVNRMNRWSILVIVSAENVERSVNDMKFALGYSVRGSNEIILFRTRSYQFFTWIVRLLLHTQTHKCGIRLQVSPRFLNEKLRNTRFMYFSRISMAFIYTNRGNSYSRIPHFWECVCRHSTSCVRGQRSVCTNPNANDIQHAAKDGTHRQFDIERPPKCQK